MQRGEFEINFNFHFIMHPDKLAFSESCLPKCFCRGNFCPM